MTALQRELEALRLVVIQKVREELEKAPTPAMLDVARKMLADLAPPSTALRRPVPIVTDLPFPPLDESPDD